MQRDAFDWYNEGWSIKIHKKPTGTPSTSELYRSDQTVKEHEEGSAEGALHERMQNVAHNSRKNAGNWSKVIDAVTVPLVYRSTGGRRPMRTNSR